MPKKAIQLIVLKLNSIDLKLLRLKVLSSLNIGKKAKRHQMMKSTCHLLLNPRSDHKHLKENRKILRKMVPVAESNSKSIESKEKRASQKRNRMIMNQEREEIKRNLKNKRNQKTWFI